MSERKSQIVIRACRGPEEYAALVEVWRSAVRATHDFLDESDFTRIESRLATDYFPAVVLTVAEKDGKPVGFAGVLGEGLEMLFVSDAVRGQGIGSALLAEVVASQAVSKVDVNEQNHSAHRFYLSKGFLQSGRSELDGDGRPYPTLHLERSLNTIELRRASFPEDSGVVSSLLEDYLRQTEAEKAEHGLVPPNASLPERYRREVASPADSLSGRRVIIARAAGVDCGIVVVGSSASGVSEIHRFWTTPAARGRGVGSTLLREALRGTDRPVRLSVWQWREPAIRLYEKLGFIPAAPWDDRPALLCLELA
jgi:putative acetyltransferase